MKSIVNKITQAVSALVSGIIISFIYLSFVGEYCITIFEANTGYSEPSMNNYYSQIAKYPIIVPSIGFVLSSILIFVFFRERYRLFAIIYLAITLLISLITLIFTKTSIVRGV